MTRLFAVQFGLCNPAICNFHEWQCIPFQV
jgi:hypothetical protein